MPTHRTESLAIFPNSTGFGYAVFKTEVDLTDCGSVRVRSAKQKMMRTHLKQLIAFHVPKRLILRDPDDPHTRASKQLRSLIGYIERLANKAGVEVTYITRRDIRQIFSIFGIHKRYDIARKIVDWFPEYGYKKPKPRRYGYSEDCHMVEFDAISLGITAHILPCHRP